MPKEIMEAVDFLTLDRDMDPAKFSGTANYVQPDEKGNILAYMLVMDNLKIRRDDKAFSKDYENSLHRGSFEYASYMNNLGALSYCEKDFARAHTCYLAASQTLLFPNIMLGIMSENGQGCLQDYADALHKYEIAAKSGNPIAENFLGVALLNGKLTDVDVGRGRRLIASSAEKTYPIAQTNLGILCLLGIGGDKDIIQAHKWMNLASQGELGAPKLILDYLTKQMSPDQIRQAQSLAREFRDRTPASGVPGASSSADNHN